MYRNLNIYVKIGKHLSANYQPPFVKYTTESHSNRDTFNEVKEFSNIKRRKVPLILKDSLADLMSFVEELLHLDEMRKAQDEVMNIKRKLKESSDRKRAILNDLYDIQLDYQKCLHEISNTTRGTDRFFELVRREVEIINEEKEKKVEFAKADETERREFSSLSNAITNSYEKEKIYSNTLKMLGIIGSIASFLLSSLGFYIHNKKTDIIIRDIEDTINLAIRKELNKLKADIERDELKKEILQLLEKQRKKEGGGEGWWPYLRRQTGNALRIIYPFK